MQSHLGVIIFSHPCACAAALAASFCSRSDTSADSSSYMADPNTSTPYYPLDPKLSYFSLTGWILAPKLKGFMTIQSNNEADAPVLQHNVSTSPVRDQLLCPRLIGDLATAQTLKEDTDVKISLLAIQKMRAILADVNLKYAPLVQQLDTATCPTRPQPTHHRQVQRQSHPPRPRSDQ